MMEKKSLLIVAFLLIFVVSYAYGRRVGNISTDEEALLALKAHITYDSQNILTTNWSTATSVCNWIGVTCGVRHLSVRALNLSSMGLTATIPPHLGNLSFLVSLSLSYNSFHGPLPNQLAKLRRLQYFNLQNNSFNGEIPSWIGSFTNLQNLSLRFNKFEGFLPPTLFNNMSSLQYLDLSFNNLMGHISPNTFCHLSKLLEWLSLSGNMFDGPVPSSIFGCTKLKVLSLAFTHFEGNIHTDIGNLTMLQGLYLGFNNNFSGTKLPTSIGKLANLEILAAGFSGLIGPILPTIANLTLLKYLYLDENGFTGIIPSSLFGCTKLKVLDLSFNNFEGSIRTDIGNLTLLQKLYLDHNNFSGIIPENIANLTGLILLRLEGNDLRGTIPTTIGKLRNLQGLGLYSNILQGSIPFTLCDLQSSLAYIYLGENELSGPIPSCLGNLFSLRELYLNSNKFTSIIPSTLWRLKDILKLDLSSNSLSGSLPLDIGSLKVITYFNLSKNKLSGSIPPSFGSLKDLTQLYLHNNRLEGSIPELFGDMISLESLDLSNNSLFGEIPRSFEKLKYLTYFNVSWNDLQGEIPNGGLLANLSAQSFLGNKRLCGASKFKVQHCKIRNHNPSHIKIIILMVIGSSVFGLAIIIIFLGLCKRKARLPIHQDHLLPLANWERMPIYELKRATNNFNEINLLGRGSFGSVYKGTLLDGNLIAVKVFNLQQQQQERALRSFDVECQVLRWIRHRNLVKIITSCCTDEFKALVMEFMPNYSLEKWLYTCNYFLDIQQRLNIMIDVASALEYLHHGSAEYVVHCDIKPSNILLDEDMVGHVSDFGIAKLLDEDQSVIQTMTLATVGYMAPEYGSEGRVSIRGDVYSFGILLIETFSRMKPTNEMFNEEMSMKQWIKKILPLGVVQIADTDLLSMDEPNYSAKVDCISSIMELALQCCADLPEERSDISDVLIVLNKIRIKFNL